MPELQKLYETILNKRNFQRKIVSYCILKKLKEVKLVLPINPPAYTAWMVKKYNAALKAFCLSDAEVVALCHIACAM